MGFVNKMLWTEREGDVLVGRDVLTNCASLVRSRPSREGNSVEENLDTCQLLARKGLHVKCVVAE